MSDLIHEVEGERPSSEVPLAEHVAHFVKEDFVRICEARLREIAHSRRVRIKVNGINARIGGIQGDQLEQGL